MRVLFAFLLCFSIFPSAQAESRKVDLSNLSSQLQNDLRKIFPFLQTENISKADLDQVIRHLVTQEQYETVQLQRETQGKNKIFRFNVGRTRRISNLNITGSDYLSESQLRSELGVAEKAVFDQQSLIEAGDRIRRIYREKGFRNTVIDLEFAKASATEVDVTMKIREGPQTRIRDVQLKTPNPDFKAIFEKVLKRKLRKEPLTDQLLISLRKEMREKFSEKRYLKAELSGPDIAFNTDESYADLSFTVVNSDRYTIDFKGVIEKGRSSVQKALDLDSFFSPNPNIGPELATRVKNYYLSEGFARVEVYGEEIDTKEPFQRLVVLNVKEGPKVKIKAINFIGHFSSPDKYYSNFLESHSSELIQDGYYNREDLEIGLKNLVIDRQNQGYLRAKIVSTKTTYTGEKKNEIIITVNIDEGPLTVLEAVSFEGNSSFSESELMNLMEIQAGTPLKLNHLEEGIYKIKEFYHNSGYLEMSLLNERENLVQYNSDSSKAKVHFKIYEGPKISVASILIEGNSLTKDYVINNELEFEVGDILTPHLIDESVRRLQRLGHFTSVDIKTLEEKTQIAERTVIVRVIDRDPGLFTLGAGVNSELGLTVRGYTGLAYRNILGTGRGVSVRVEGNYNLNRVKYLERKMTLGYLEPYLLNSRVKGRFNYTLADFVSNYTSREGTELKQITFSLEQDITSHILASYDLFSSAQIRKFPLDDWNTEIGRTETVIISTGPTVDFDYRDHPFNPSQGTFTRINLEYASPPLGSNETIHYLRAFASFTKYQTFYKPGWVWANSIRGGDIRNWSPEGGVPYSLKGFTLGGQSTIRGFQPTEAFPNDLDFKNASGVDSKDVKLLTSANMYLLKSEFRIPIDGAFGAAVFYDGGAVFVKGYSFEDPYRDAVGVGLRYATPIGAVSLDLGYKLDLNRDRTESQWPIYFSVGTF